MDASQARSLARRFDEYGLRLEEPIELTALPDLDTRAATLRHEHGSAPVRLGYAPRLTASALEWARRHYVAHERLLLLGPRVTERSAEIFRSLGINYLDQSGNAFISFDGVHIDVRGRSEGKRERVDVTPAMTRGGVNLFSSKRSQLIFAVLSWPDLLNGPVRKLATAAGVSIGLAQETLDLLNEYGFLDDDRQIARHQHEQLLDLWSASYRTGLGARAKELPLSGTIPAEVTHSLYISGESAVPDLLRPESALLFTSEDLSDVIRAYRWRRDDNHPNLILRHKFWKEPGADALPGIQRAPWLLVYADLLASGDSRQREAADELRRSEGG